MYKFDIMKFKFVGILAFCVGLVSFPSCDTDVEALEIQKLKTYDEQYYANIRAFKQSDHEVSLHIMKIGHRLKVLRVVRILHHGVNVSRDFQIALIL